MLASSFAASSATSSPRVSTASATTACCQQQSHRNHRARSYALEPGPTCGRGDERHRSAATPRAPLPMLRRAHDHHRDLRDRLPAAPLANYASRSNPDRYLMSTSHDTVRFSALVIDRQHCSSTQCLSALHLASCASPKHSVSAAHSNPISRSSTYNHKILAL